MATKKKAVPKRRLLSSSRPKTTDHHHTARPSSQASRALIRKYHTLKKQLAQAKSADDENRATSIRAEIECLGGLSSYQRASIAGQSVERGGDSSKLLIKWLTPVEPAMSDLKAGDGSPVMKNLRSGKLRLLEVGALSPENACAKSGFFEMERIDLQSQHPSIKRQDFMERPVPSSEGALAQEGFDVISLSLVLNFVPDAAARGEMLKRVSSFLRQRSGYSDTSDLNKELFPSLFLVLPASCVLNSRYLDEKRLEAMLESLGYRLVRKKISNKLVSFLWRYEGNRELDVKVFKKEEVGIGGKRNNFAIILK